MNCTRCEGTGFLNIFQVDAATAEAGHEAILAWMKSQIEPHDVTVCDCCGNGENWYGEPGAHYGANDPVGKHGPYTHNGGLCECH